MEKELRNRLGMTHLDNEHKRANSSTSTTTSSLLAFVLLVPLLPITFMRLSCSVQEWLLTLDVIGIALSDDLLWCLLLLLLLLLLLRGNIVLKDDRVGGDGDDAVLKGKD